MLRLANLLDLLLEDLRRDVPYAWRTLAANPGFAIVAVLTLSVGIGATSAIFTVVDALLVEPLPYSDRSDRLVRLMAHVPAEAPGGAPRRVTVGLTAAEIAELRSRTRALSHVGTAALSLMGLRGHDDAARLQGARVSASVFPMLGTPPLAGRAISAEDESAGRDVILLGHAMWRRFFGGDPAVVGRSVTLTSVLGRRTEREYTVIGVMPPRFEFPNSTVQFWLPLYKPASAEAGVTRGPMLGLLADGVSMEAAAADIGPVVRELRRHGPNVRYELVRERDEIVTPVRPALVVLTAAVGSVLLIACANVANLLLARAAAREREVAVRAALGAGRGRLVRQALAESGLLSVLGGAGGVIAAFGGVRLLHGLAATPGRMDLPLGLAFPRLHEIAVDARTVAFTTATAVLTALLLGLAPALRASLVDPVAALRSAAGSSAPGFVFRRGERVRGALVVAEVALAMVLLVGGGLLARSFLKLARVDAGYDPANVLTFQVALPVDPYPDARLLAFSEDLVARLRLLPGVRGAAYANQLPMVSLRDTGGGLWKTPDPARAFAPDAADARLVSHGYLDAMGIRVLAGRGFTARDGAGRPRVLLVNEVLARREFPGQDPIGREVFIGRDTAPWRIAGVVANVRQFGLDREPEPQFFADMRQWPGATPVFPVGAYYAVRTSGDPEALVPAVRDAVRHVEREARLFNVARMDALVSTTIARPRLFAVILGAFALAGTVLAAVGIYGVIAYGVAQRTREIGIRMALGARRGDVLSLVLRHGLALTAAGLALGLAGAAAATRYLEGMLFGLTPLDATTFAGVPVLFAAVAALASCVPAGRATRVDPLIAIRCE